VVINNKPKVFALCWGFLLPALAQPALGGNGLALTDCVQGIRARSQVLNRMSVTIDGMIYNVERPEDRHDPAKREVLSRKSYEVHRKDGKTHVRHTYLDKTSGEVKSWNVFAWDGERSRGYGEFAHLDPDPTGGLIAASRTGAFYLGYYTAPMEETVPGFGDARPLASLISTSAWRLSDSESIGPYSAVLLEGPVEPDSWLKVWVDPARDFAPVRMDISRHIGDDAQATYRLLDVKLKEADDVWVIAGCTVLVHCPAVMSNRWQAFQFAMRDVRVGVDLPDELFVLKFPPGKRVYDDITKLVYRVKYDGTMEPVFLHGGDAGPNLILEADELPEGLEDMGSSPRKANDDPLGPGGIRPGSQPEQTIASSPPTAATSALRWWKYLLVAAPFAAVVCALIYRRRAEAKHEGPL